MGKDFARGIVLRTPLGVAEKALLLACVQAEPTPLPQPTADFDWQTFAKRATGDGLGALVHKRLKSETFVPAKIRALLKRNYYTHLTANHIRLQELNRLGDLLGNSGIPLLVLKGGALASTIYDDPAYRFMGDLDVAVPPHQAQEAYRLLIADGYHLHDADKLPDDDTALLHQSGWHLRLTKKMGAQIVELEFHWPLRQDVLVEQVVTLDVAHIWDTAIPLDETHNLYQPSPVMMLLHLCIHTGVQHRFNELGLRHYVDIDRLIRHHQPDPAFWQTFIALAKKAGAVQASYFSLQLTKQLMGTEMPASILTQLQPARWKQTLFAQQMSHNDVFNRTRALHDRQRYAWRVLTTDRPSAFLSATKRHFFPGKTYLSDYYQSQNNALLLAYTLYHPFHILSRAVSRRWRGLISLSKQYVTAVKAAS